MPSKGVLGLAGGSLIFVILALAYIFTDRGREVGDNLGRTASERLERLFPDEVGRGEAGGTEPEGEFRPADPPEITDRQASPQIGPDGLPPASAPFISPEVGAQNARIAALEAHIQNAYTSPAAGAPTVGGARGVTAANPYAEAGFNADRSVYTTVGPSGQIVAFATAQSAGRPSTPAEAANARASTGLSSAPGAPTQRSGESAVAFVQRSAQSYVNRQQQSSAQTAARAATATAPARVQQAAARGRRLATQRQIVSPSQTRPQDQSSAEILSSYNSFRSNTNFNQKGVQYNS